MVEDGERIVRLVIVGRVQGVGFRHWMVGEARRLGLRGWVRNRSDGSVEALVAGPPAAVDAIIAACWSGPPSAVVSKVDVLHPDAAALASLSGAAGFGSRATAA